MFAGGPAYGIRLNGAPAELVVGNVRVVFDTTHGAPIALFRNASAGNVAIQLVGPVGADSDRMVMVSNTGSGATTTVVHRDLAAVLVNPAQPRQQAGRFYAPPVGATAGAAPGVGTITALPFGVHASGATITALGVAVSMAGTGGSAIRVGIYADNAGLPGTLVSDCGTISTDTAGSASVTASVAVGRGTYWLASMQSSVGTGSAGPTLQCVSAASMAPLQQQFLGSPSMLGLTGSGGTTGYVGSAAVSPATAMPATYPSAAFGSITAVPLVGVQLTPSTT